MGAGAVVLVGVLTGCGDGNVDDFIWGRTPSFLPDGRVVYSQNLSTPSDQVLNLVTGLDAGVIWRINADGSSPTKITPDGRGPDFFPKVSPDGTRIAFASGENSLFDIWVMDIDGSDRRQLTFDNAVDTTPNWSPDGRRIVFVSDRTGNSDLWSVELDGSGLQQLTSFPSDESTPAYSPDGTLLAYGSNRDRSNFDIWVEDAAGGNPRQVTRKDNAATNVSDGGPAWAPDGRLAFERWEGNWNVYIVNLDGTGLTRLTDDQGHDGDPAFGPGGEVAFTSSRTGWWQVWLMNVDGTGQRQLTGAR